MFRTLCAFLLLASPALAAVVDVFGELVIDGDTPPSGYSVRPGGHLIVMPGATVYQIDGTGAVSVHGGTFNGPYHWRSGFAVDINGGVWPKEISIEDADVSISGGLFRSNISLSEVTNGGSLEISGGEFHGSVYLQCNHEPPGGVHSVSISGGDWGDGGRFSPGCAGSGSTVDVYGKAFQFSTSGTRTQVFGMLTDGGVFYASTPDLETINFVSTQSFLLGDADFDGVIGLSDLNLIRNNFGSDGIGDTNGDRDVDLDDLNIVRNNFGASSIPVPEPTSIGLAIVALTFLVTKYPGSSRRTSLPTHRRQS